MRVYISSTYLDLREQREAVAKAVRRLNCQPVCMEDYVARDDRPVDKCLADVRSCQVYVGLLAWRYGFRPPQRDRSITQLEYEQARTQGIPCLLFLAQDPGTWPKKWRDTGTDETDLNDFRNEVEQRHTVSYFAEVRELETLVATAVSLQLLEFARRAGTGNIDIPVILPYMADRSRQHDQLADALRAHLKNRRRCPCVVFIHGDENEAHGEFVQKLHEVTLPKLLRLNPEDEPIRRYPLVWGELGRAVKERQRQLARRVAEVLIGDRDAEVDHLAAEVARLRCPVIVSSLIDFGDWQHDEPRLLDWFLNWWEGWPDLMHPLLVLVAIRYQDPSSRWRLQQFRIRRRNRRMQEFLEEGLPAQNYNISVVLLDKLQGMRLQDVINWIDQHAGEYCRTSNGRIRDPLILREVLIPRLQKLFEASERIPMAILAPVLRGELQKCLSEELVS